MLCITGDNFDRFVTADTHWLAPDNFQETPEPLIATRTSPTNIGLQLLATASASNLGFLTRGELADRPERAFDAMERMPRVQGHFFNWYNLADLTVLDPPYVSTVGSGNLAGHLVALAQGCAEMVLAPVDDARVWSAIEAEVGPRADAHRAWVGERLLAYQSAVFDLRRRAVSADTDTAAAMLWARQRLQATADELSTFDLDPECDASVSLREAASSSPAAAALATRLDALAARAREMAAAMDFRLVYDEKRRLFSIGYDARTGIRDESLYDLLASESRLASFMAGLHAARLSGGTGAGDDPCAALRCAIALEPDETRDVVLLLGAAESDTAARTLIARYASPAAASRAIRDAADSWNDRLSVVTVRTPDPQFDTMLNRWSLYQALSCRTWARSAFYQSSGAYGFRDQLQDSMALVYAEPAIARAHLLLAANRQFVEGDVQHWWHEPSGRGVRTRFSDDLAWLPFVADHYVRVTGDDAVLDARVTYLDMRPLEAGEQEAYDLPSVADATGSLYDHCVRAIERACTAGGHGLPLTGAGDWNDGMNRIGARGKGESVWLAWFLATTLRSFAVHAEARGDADVATRWRARAQDHAAAAERSAWDGDRYRRAFYDDGSPLGTAADEECRIDAIAQSWAVLSGLADPARARSAMRSVNELLVRDDTGLVLLLTPRSTGRRAIRGTSRAICQAFERMEHSTRTPRSGWYSRWRGSATATAPPRL
jgi:hypothetical protein